MGIGGDHHRIENIFNELIRAKISIRFLGI
jgi:hypothetical protein